MLDRIWLVLIAASFALIGTGFVILTIERVGWRPVVVFVVVIVIGFIRHRSSLHRFQ